MKILVLLSRFPYPLEKGDKLRAFYQIKELAKRHEVVLCTLTDKPVDDQSIKALENHCASLHIFPLKRPLIYWNTVKQFFTSKPYQTGYFYQSRIKRKVHDVVQTEKPDHIYCQLIRTTEYVKNIHVIPKTLDYMDALSKGMFRHAAISRGIKKRLLKEEGKRLAEYEHRIFDYFNFHTIISEQDRQYISHPNKDAITIVENGISNDFTTFVSDCEKDFDLVFTGNMNYPPNIACCEYIVNEILPILKDKGFKLKVLISGANPHQRVKSLEVENEVVVTGWVEDIRESYSRAKIFVAPLFIGTGLQNKLLEAMAMGLPSITTPLANNALKAVDNETVLIASNAEQFADSIVSLLEDSDRWKNISVAGRKFVQERYSWEGSVIKLEKLMQSKH
ncbi:MAG: glycosyltransferase [Crocinitomicaceae bacterium]